MIMKQTFIALTKEDIQQGHFLALKVDTNYVKKVKDYIKFLQTKNTFKVGDRVRPVSKKDAFEIACGLTTPRKITTKTEFEVAVVVEQGRTHNDVIESGLIVVPISDTKEFSWPYIWDFKKFVKVTE